jgi:hypothetical protein
MAPVGHEWPDPVVRTWRLIPDYYEEWVQHEPYDRHDPFDAPLDSEIDFDDEQEDDQLPLDELEAIELGVNLDDPESLARAL